MENKPIKLVLWLLAYFLVLIWSAINPHDRFTWWLEVIPALVALAVLALTYTSFHLTGLLYCLILLHCFVLMIGGHYTYAEVPFFEHLLDSERNNYDKVGHFFQGFVPAMVVREILIRKQIVNGIIWQNLLIVSVCLAVSALYELIEWAVALATGDSAEAFLGTQGYQWDTQTDMAAALLGAIVALLLLSKFHDRGLRSI